MSKDRMFSIITIACFVSILFIPIGLVTMWFSTSWKKKLKFILSAAFTLLYVGIVALIGVVVNNGIVLVDAINRLLDEKDYPVLEACLRAAKGRLQINRRESPCALAVR